MNRQTRIEINRKILTFDKLVKNLPISSFHSNYHSIVALDKFCTRGIQLVSTFLFNLEVENYFCPYQEVREYEQKFNTLELDQITYVT